MFRLAMWLGWIPAGLLLTPVWLDGDHYEGFTPETSDLTVAAAVLLGAAGLVLGALHGSRTTRGAGAAAIGRRLASVTAGMAGAAALYVAGDHALYRWVVPLDDAPRGLGTSAALVLIAVAGAAAGFLAGLLRRVPPRPVPARRAYLIAVVVALLGIYAVTGFVRVGAELATTEFQPGPTVPAGSMELPAGRHAVFARYNDQPPACTITRAGGERAEVRQPTVEFTDNSDSAVTVLFGVFDLPAAGRVTVDCPRGEIGPPPVTPGPLGRLIFTPIALLCLIGAVPGALLAIAVRRARVTRRDVVARPAG